MEIKKQIETKYGVHEAEFTFDDGVWVAVMKNGKLSAVIQANTYEEAFDEIIECFEMLWEFNEEMENNPHKNKVDKQLLTDITNGKKFWSTYKN